MRKILFRAKRADNGEWVEGYYVKFVPYEGHTMAYWIQPLKDNGTMGIICEVIPKTIGQYTGLWDENGKKIFEGDIVIDRYANYYTPIFQNGIYMAYNPRNIKLKKAEPSTQFNLIWKEGCEVIGNIHDNPELLGGE